MNKCTQLSTLSIFVRKFMLRTLVIALFRKHTWFDMRNITRGISVIQHVIVLFQLSFLNYIYCGFIVQTAAKILSNAF